MMCLINLTSSVAVFPIQYLRLACFPEASLVTFCDRGAKASGKGKVKKLKARISFSISARRCVFKSASGVLLLIIYTSAVAVDLQTLQIKGRGKSPV